MAETIERFAVSEKGFSLPVRDVLTGRGFVTGKSGSGKSNTASVIAEELLERGLGMMIIDTDGEYKALKERYELLQVGGDDHCDREITAEDAALVADLALDENVPIILDVSGYMDEEVAQDVIHAVVRELFVKEKQCQKPFLLFVEEAHEFIPERGGGDDLHKMLVRVAKRGRKRGLGICAMSQRPAAVAKDYITQCDWLVWHRLTWENDTKVAGRILGGDASDSVQSLGDGEALVMTDWDEKISRVQFRRKKTVDKGSTPDLYDAYGPPSAREDHVTRDDEADADETDADDETGSREVTEPSASPDGNDGPAVDETDAGGDGDGPTAAGENAVTFEDEASGATGGDVDGAGDGTEPSPAEPESGGSDWDLSDVDIQPRGRSVDAPSPEPASPPPAQPAAGVGTHTAAEAASQFDQPVEGSTGSPKPTQRSRPRIEEPDEYDPVWEIGQLIVYCYVAVASAHGRLLRRIDAFFLARFAGFRRRAFGTRRGPRANRGSGSRRLDRRLARLLSVTLVVGVYALALGAVVASFVT